MVMKILAPYVEVSFRNLSSLERYSFTLLSCCRTKLRTLSGLKPPANKYLRSVFSLDRKSTRLNSSHLVISYAVFCLKKKKKITITTSSMRNDYDTALHAKYTR